MERLLRTSLLPVGQTMYIWGGGWNQDDAGAGIEAVVRMIQEQTGLTAEIDRILYTWTFMVGSVCSLGLTYLCYTDMEEEDVQLSEDLHDCRWVSADEFGDYISNKRMLEDIDKAELY